MKTICTYFTLGLLAAVNCPLVADDLITFTSRDKTFSFSVPVKPDAEYEDDDVRVDAYDVKTDQDWIIIRLPYRGEIHPAGRRDFLREMFNYEFDPDGGDEILSLEETRLQKQRCMKWSLMQGDKISHQALILTKKYFYRFKTKGKPGAVDEDVIAAFFDSIRLHGEEAIADLAASRLWSDQSGKFQIEGELVEANDDTVTIRKRDRSVSKLAINRLSKSDAQLVNKMISKTPPKAGKKSREWILSSQHQWPDFFVRDGEVVPLPIGTVIDERHQTLIFSEKADYLNRDFDLDVLVSLVADPDAVCKIGLGDGESKSSIVLMLATPAPSFHKGLVQVADNVGGGQELGRVTDPGTHLLSIRKRKDRVMVNVDANNGGPSDEDIHTIVTDLSIFAPDLTNENAHLFFGGGGIFHSIRLDFDPPELKIPEPKIVKNDTPDPKKMTTSDSGKSDRGTDETEKVVKSDPKREPKKTTRSKKPSWPKDFAPNRDIVPVANGIRMKDRIKGVVVTKKPGYLEKDFVMEVVMSLPPDPAGVTNIGIGNMESKSCALIMMGTPSPSFHKGLIQVGNNIFGGEELARIDQTEKRLIRIEKKGESITFTLDVTMDGQSDDDVVKTVENIREYAEELNDENSYLFFGGAGVFHEVKLDVEK